MTINLHRLMKAVMYHYVRTFDARLPHFRYLHVEDFEKQLDHFAANHRFLSLEEFRECLRSGTPAEKGLVLTFDDGFKDYYRYVLPALQKRNLWGLFYIPTRPLQCSTLLDVHRVHVLIGKCGAKKVLSLLSSIVSDDMLCHAHVREFREMTYRTQTNDEYTNYVKRALNYYIDETHRTSVMETLMRELVPEEASFAEEFYMTENELRQMDRAGMVLGSHSHSHPVMSKLSYEMQQHEISVSFQVLERVLDGLRLKTFCYPYGAFHSFNQHTLSLLEQERCLFLFNVEARDISCDDIRVRQQFLPRYDCNLFPFGRAK